MHWDGCGHSAKNQTGEGRWQGDRYINEPPGDLRKAINFSTSGQRQQGEDTLNDGGRQYQIINWRELSK